LFQLFTIASKKTIVVRYSSSYSFLFLKLEILRQIKKLQIPPHKTIGIKTRANSEE